MYYNITGHGLEIVNGELGNIPGFPYFLANPESTNPLLSVKLGEKVSGKKAKLLHQFTMEEVNCEFLNDDKSYFCHMKEIGDISWWMEIRPEKDKWMAITNMHEGTNPYIMRYALWLAFGIAALHQKTISVHASTVTYNGRSILFLGESGTGKSTQSRLWLQHIPNTELLNDDSPFICMGENGTPVVWGSPWSGKTPCYKNIQTPIAALVRLRQAPQNTIKRLKTIEAIGALQPSLPPMLAADAKLSVLIQECLSFVLREIPVYGLDCLPNEEAAKLVYSTLKNDGWVQ